MKNLIFLVPFIFLIACSKHEKLNYQIISTRSHDAECYTQGLEYYGKNLIESSGGYGNSNIREVDPSNGAVLRKRPLAKNVFAEGITVLNNELWVLSWKENTVLVLEPATFKFIRSHTYQGEGWGLTHNGGQLIMSDGTSKLKFIDPKDFSIKRTIEVTRNGEPLERLNELEMIKSEILANIYTTDEIVRISPADGKVTGTLDLSALRKRLTPPHRAEALNGIALDPISGNMLVTGKLWPSMFEIKISAE